MQSYLICVHVTIAVVAVPHTGIQGAFDWPCCQSPVLFQVETLVMGSKRQGVTNLHLQQVLVSYRFQRVRPSVQLRLLENDRCTTHCHTDYLQESRTTELELDRCGSPPPGTCNTYAEQIDKLPVALGRILQFNVPRISRWG